MAIKPEVKKVLDNLTLEEKASLLTGGTSALATASLERLGLDAKRMADGPNGMRNYEEGSNCTTLPSCCATGATWSREAAYKMGQTIAKDCVHHGRHMILGPGLNMKRNALCGRNFEYFSEDPVLTGEMAAAYVKGCEENGVGTSMKHYACNSQENYRTTISSEIDERTMREIYLRAFEIAAKKGNPASIMCAYNKINSIWCSENKMLINDILRNEWGYEGIMVSDWGAVHDTVRSVKAGMDLRMPRCDSTVSEVVDAVNSGKLTEDEVDRSAARVLEFLMRPVSEDKDYDRDEQHKAAYDVAKEAICLLRNDDNILPLTAKKYKRIAVTGEYAVKPYINGQGSAEVFTDEAYIDSPVECLRRNLPDVQIDYFDYLPAGHPEHMLWHYMDRDMPNIDTYDAVIVFTGDHKSEDSENIDRNDNHLSGYIEAVLKDILEQKSTVILVLTSGCSTFKGPDSQNVPAVVQMWPTGEAAGAAVADVLTGKVNPSGKLSETFPTMMRRDLDQVGDSVKVEYNEKWAIGYRYYDLHPEEIWFPFGHGMSYTTFEYSNPELETTKCGYRYSFDLTNTGEFDGAEVAQLYIADPLSTVTKPVKELKNFEKVYLKAGETRRITFELTAQDFAYYNVMLHDWVVESGRYDIIIGSSSRDLRLTTSLVYDNPDCYTMTRMQGDMIAMD